MWGVIALFAILALAALLMIRGIVHRRQDKIIHAALRREAWERIRAGRRRRWWLTQKSGDISHEQHRMVHRYSSPVPRTRQDGSVSRCPRL